MYIADRSPKECRRQSYKGKFLPANMTIAGHKYRLHLLPVTSLPSNSTRAPNVLSQAPRSNATTFFISTQTALVPFSRMTCRGKVRPMPHVFLSSNRAPSSQATSCTSRYVVVILLEILVSSLDHLACLIFYSHHAEIDEERI